MASRGGAAKVIDLQPTISGAPTAASLAALAEATVTGYVVLVTPDLAEQWLAANRDNRPIRPTHMRTLAKAMGDQLWRLTHQGIAFSDAGRLIDGQHRLQAIIHADVPVRLLVFTGLPDAMFGVLDRGARRKHADDIGEDRRVIEPCAWLARVIHRNEPFVPSTDEVRRIFWLYREQLAAIIETSARSVKTRSAAGIKAALAVRLFSASPLQRALLLGQFEALVAVKASQMDTTTEALWRRLENLTFAGGHDVEERGAVAWLGFDPSSRGLLKIAVRDLANTLETIKVQVQQDLAMYPPHPPQGG